jgi:tetratricopeptide (TPR) repeat protein
MSVRVLLSVLALVLLAPGPAPAQPAPPLDPEAATPYLWQVVVQARPHPLLTPAFRDALRRDLLAALQPALDPLGTVEVIDLADTPRDRWEPLWQQFDDKGFAALDAPRDLTRVKTHVLRVEVRGGAYHLESRQHDGFTGLASPVVRTQVVRTPDLVGRTAGLMIDRDFGTVGTVEPIAGKDDVVRVRFRGGKLGPLDRVVKPGDVFAVSRVTRTTRPAPPPVRTATGKLVAPPPGSVPPPAFTPAGLPYTLLRVAEAPKDGAATCTVLTGYKVALPAGPAVAGFRCMKLGTVQALVSVRLIGGDGTAATTPVANVRATEAGFGAAPAPRDFLDFRDGLYRSARPLTGVACVTVTLGATREARFPVPVLGPEPVTLRFEVDAKAEERAAFERAVLAVSARAADARVGQAACFDAVAKLIEGRKNPDALARARAGFEAADTADKVLAEEVQQLKEQADKAPGAATLLAAVEQQLAALRVANGQLAARVKDLEAVVAKAKDNSSKEAAVEVQAQSLTTRISLLLARGEVDEALAAYDQLATVVPDNADVKARRDKLAAEWKPKDEAHAKARDYLKAWAALATVQDLKDSLPLLRVAVDTCKKAGDKYAFRRLLGAFGGLPARLTDLIKDLDPNAAGDLKSLQDAKTVREVVGKLEQEVTEFLKE